MKEPKPIFIVEMPMSENNSLDKFSETLAGKMPEYHVIIIANKEHNEYKYTAIYPPVK